MINTVIISGTIADTPELEETNSGIKFCKLDLLTTKKKQVDGEWQDIEVMIPGITFWGENAENLCARCVTGEEKVIIHGKLDSSEWEKEVGDIRYFLKFSAQGFEILPLNIEESDENIPF